MKKNFFFWMAAIVMLIMSSCQQEAGFGTEATVSFQVGTPEIATRADYYDYSDGKTATVLQYAVYDNAGNILDKLTVTDGEIHGSTIVNLQLTTGNTYSVIFWAAAEGAPYTVDFANKTMTVDYSTAVSNDENRDAFYKYHTFTVNGAQTEIIELRRPFAQLNIGTSDYEASEKAGYEPKYSSVKVSNVYKTLDLVEGKVSDPTAVVYSYNAIDKTETFPVAGYEYLAMNYLLVASDKEVVDVEFGYTELDATAAKTRTLGSVPVQRNHRTNIYGQLLTSNVEINVEIVPEYYDEDYNIIGDVWDGNITEPTVNPTNENEYVINKASDLAWFAAAVNGTLPVVTRASGAADDFAGKTFVLSSDINLNGVKWTPIGTSENPFKGTFDGANHTIFNLVVDGGSNSDQGLFGFTQDGEIKNLTIENAKVSGRLNVGVVAGTPYTSKYTNINVIGHVEVNGMAYVGGVGGKNAYANWTNITVNVDKSSYVNANSVENGKAYRSYVGGVVGFNGEGGHSFTNIKSNINVKGSTCDVAGLFGIAHYGNKFENCSCSGNVEIYAAEEAEEAQEIGGIAGVWHNETGYTVEMKDCSFTGTLKTNIDNVNFYYNGLVGKPYSATGEGKLIIDGACVVTTADELVAALEANQDVVLLANNIKIDPAKMSNAYGTTGLNVKNGQTIDGGGHILDIKGAGGTWDSGINTTGGIIKNITVTGSFRGIFINHNSDYSEKVVLENVIIKGTTYTISCDKGLYQEIEATNCSFYGWTSFAKTVGKAKFTNCYFGEGSGYKFCRPYAPTEFVNCTFCPGYSVDETQAAVTFTDCTFEK